MAELKTVNLDRLRKVVGRVEFEKHEYDVVNIGGFGYQILFNLVNENTTQQSLPEEERDIPDVMALYEAAATCLPDMTEAQVRKMNPDQIAVVLTLASGNIEKVEELVNAVLEKNVNGSNGRLKPPAKSRAQRKG